MLGHFTAFFVEIQNGPSIVYRNKGFVKCHLHVNNVLVASSKYSVRKEKMLAEAL